MEHREQINTSDWVDERIGALEPAGNWQPQAERALARVRERGRRAAERRSAWSWATAAASTVCVVVLAVPATRAAVFRACTAACAVVWPGVLAEDSGELPAAGGPLDSEAGGASLPGGAGSLPGGKAVGEFAAEEFRPAPEFALPDADGRVLRLSDLKGKVVLLNFWATWCPPCKIEMPWFVDLQRKYKDRGFTVVAVSLDEEGFAAVRPFADSLRLNFPVVIGDDPLAAEFGGVTALPTTFLIDREGRIRSVHPGLVSAGEVAERIEKLLE